MHKLVVWSLGTTSGPPQSWRSWSQPHCLLLTRGLQASWSWARYLSFLLEKPTIFKIWWGSRNSVLILPVQIEGFRPEWCISSMIYSRDIPFWSETLKILYNQQKQSSSTTSRNRLLQTTKVLPHGFSSRFVCNPTVDGKVFWTCFGLVYKQSKENDPKNVHEHNKDRHVPR